MKPISFSKITIQTGNKFNCKLQIHAKLLFDMIQNNFVSYDCFEMSTIYLRQYVYKFAIHSLLFHHNFFQILKLYTKIN